MADKLTSQSRAQTDRGCFGLNINRASRVVSKKFDDAFRPLGINHWQFSLLMALHMRDGLTVSELAKVLGVDRTTVTANLKPLERKEFLTVAVDVTDARARRIALTENGVALLEEAFPLWSEVNTSIGQALSTKSGDDVLQALTAISDLQS